MEKVRYAGFWLRFVAGLIDIAILELATWIVELLILGALYWVWRIHAGAASLPDYANLFDPVTEQGLTIAIYGALAIVYYSWGHYRFGTTLGKRPFRIRVVRDGRYALGAPLRPLTLGQSILRCFCYVLSYLPLGGGFLLAAVHPEKRALHDLIAGTVSVVQPRGAIVQPLAKAESSGL